MRCAIALIGVVTTAIKRAPRSLEQCARGMGRGSPGQWPVTGAPKNAQKPHPPPKLLHFFFGFSISFTPKSAFFFAPDAKKVFSCSQFEGFPVSLAACLLPGFGWGGCQTFTVLELGNG